MPGKYRKVEPTKRVDKYFWGDPWVLTMAHKVEFTKKGNYCCVEIDMPKAFGSWVCTRAPGHPGPHIAASDINRICCIWDEEGNYFERDDLVLEQEDA